MTEKPILMSAPMVRAILAGQKTETRRPIKPQPSAGVRKSPFVQSGFEDGHGRELKVRWSVGDRLWVREAWSPGYNHDPDALDGTPKCGIIYRADMAEAMMPVPYEVAEKWAALYSDDGPDDPVVRPSIFMPRWASRITLDVTEVRIERLQAITDEGAIAEGIYRVDPTSEEIASEDCTVDDFVFMAPGTRQGYGPTKEDRAREQWGPDARFAYRCLWNTINGPGAWDLNLFVAVIKFRRVK